ncbi:MAG: FAD-dependent oxidoreductase [Betaproteobacteria bacterium]|nr:FAD-dependent oxidoreductase [Betaproteobacteria bacterium]
MASELKRGAPRRVVVVGGVAGGMSAAARLRRLDERAEILVLERDDYVSFANCGLPYHIGGEIEERDALLLQTPQSLADSLALEVRTGHEVVAIDRAAARVRVVERASRRSYEERYDRLVLATGAAPVKPPLPGIDHPRVFTLRSIPDMDAIKRVVDAGARSAVVVGGGYIGLEVAEAFRHRGLEVTLVEAGEHVMAVLDPEMSREVEDHLEAKGVRLHLETTAHGFAPAHGGAVSVDLGGVGSVVADLVVVAVGVRPESSLARAAGLDVTQRGAVIVDEHQRTSDPAIYAVGDAVAVRDTVTGERVVVPLAGPANRQGRIAADHIVRGAGRSSARYTTTQGTGVVKIFDMTVAMTGASEATLRRIGHRYGKVYLHPSGHASYYPGTAPMHLKLLFDAEDGRVLGAQAAGWDGVDKRIDVLAVAIRAGLAVEDLEELELAYAPPYGSAKDPVNMAGFQAANVLRGDLKLWYAEEWGTLPADAVVLDVRSPAEHEHWRLPGSTLIPLKQLRQRLAELPRERPVYVYCRSGFRSYLAYRVLAQEGFDVRTLSGGELTFRAVHRGSPKGARPAPVITYAEDETALT